MNVRQFESFYQVFYNYFSSGMDQRKTLVEYGLLPSKKGSYNDKASVASTFSNLKKKYPEEYKQAREDYLESIGIHRASVWSQVYNIAQTASLERDRLRALELLTRLMGDDTADGSLVSQANKLTIEVIPPQSAVSSMNDDL